MSCDNIVNFFESNFVSAALGAFATIIAVRWTITHQNEKHQEQKNDEIKAVLSAIKTEMLLCFETYMEIGKELEDLGEGKPFEILYRVEEDYFAIFNGNSSFIGTLPAELRLKVVKAYIDMKSLLDTFRLNNENIESVQSLLQRLVEIHIANGIDGKVIENHINKSLETYKVSAVVLAKSLKDKHVKARDSIEMALNAMKSF